MGEKVRIMAVLEVDKEKLTESVYEWPQRFYSWWMLQEYFQQGKIRDRGGVVGEEYVRRFE